MKLEFASDSVVVDVSSAPWMKVAEEQRKQGIREHNDYASFKKLLWEELARVAGDAACSPEALENIARNQNQSSPLSLGVTPALDPYRARDYEAEARKRALQQSGSKNAAIEMYLKTVKTDPVADRKGRSWELSPVAETKDGWVATPWCAAFVNWCLKQVGAPYLGVATAASWLRFGTPLPRAVYGCVTIVKPSRSTRSTTGHVAFYVEHSKAGKLSLLGGNQSDAVQYSNFAESTVLGYRWPTSFNHLLSGGATAVT